MLEHAIALLRVALPDQYTVENYIDRGGQGSVFRGTLDGQDVALKVFQAAHSPKRLARELAVLERLDCEHVVKMLRAETIKVDGNECALVAYEYLSGGDMRQFLEPGAAPVPVATLIQIGKQIGCGIECLWKERCVHRDVKPANIIEAANGRYVLVDVALAMHLDLSQVTRPGVAPGTLGYLSPEQAKGRRNLTIRSDVFSLGVTLYELATKRHPFNRAQPNVGRMEPQSLGQVRTDLPNELVTLIHSMLGTIPANRPTNVVDHFKLLAEAT